MTAASTPRTFFIVNPAAGHHRALKLWDGFQKLWDGPTEWALGKTQRRGHASELARDALKWGYDRIVAVGGDGTLSEAAHGLLSAARPLPDGVVLGHFPVGSGCDFARHFHLPREASGWKAMLEGGKTARIDAGRVEWTGPEGKVERYFLNIAMAGLAGDIVHAMERSGKPLGGTLSYMAASLAHLVRSKPKEISLALDGRAAEAGRYHLLAFANTSTTGGGMRIAPNADPVDGLLDLVSVKGLSRARLLWSFPKLYSGAHLAVDGIESGRARTVEATSRSAVRLNIDGEPIGHLPARFELHPRALTVMLPAAKE